MKTQVPYTKVFGLLLAIAGAPGCSPAPATNADAASATSEAPESRLSRENFEKLSQRVHLLEMENEVRGGEYEAYIQTTAEEYARIRTELGYIALSLSDISEYANGSKLVLTMGNPSAATLNDLTADLEWGRVNPDGIPTGKVHSKTQTFNEPLYGATWRKYTITLSDVPPKELGYLRVKNLNHKSISLRSTN